MTIGQRPASCIYSLPTPLTSFLLGNGGTLAAFNYDGQNRLKTAYEHNYLYDSAGRTTLFEGGAGFTFDSVHPHAVNTVNRVDRYDYDASGDEREVRIEE